MHSWLYLVRPCLTFLHLKGFLMPKVAISLPDPNIARKLNVAVSPATGLMNVGGLLKVRPEHSRTRRNQ